MRDEAVRVDAARVARDYGVRFAEEDGTLGSRFQGVHNLLELIYRRRARGPPSSSASNGRA